MRVGGEPAETFPSGGGTPREPTSSGFNVGRTGSAFCVVAELAVPDGEGGAEDLRVAEPSEQATVAARATTVAAASHGRRFISVAEAAKPGPREHRGHERDGQDRPRVAQRRGGGAEERR